MVFLVSEYATGFFIPIIILLSLATISSILISIFKLDFLPTFAVEILIGLIIAHWFNNLMIDLQFSGIVDGIYVLGLSMMMFLSGYDVDFDIFKEIIADDAVKPKNRHINIFRTALVIFVITYLISVIISIGINYFFANNKVLGIILLSIVFASTFAAMVVPILHNEGLLQTVIGKIIAAIANLSEIVSIGFLTVLMIVLDVKRKYAIIFLLLAIFIVLYRIVKRYKIGKFFDKITEGIDHLVTRVIFVLILFLVLLSDLAGGEYIIGAFFAGMFVRHTRFSEEVVVSLSRIIYGVFAPLFFILVGARIDFLVFIQETSNIWLVIILFFAYFIVEIPILLLLKWYNLNTIIPSMILISCTVIVPIAAGHIGLSHNLFSEAFAQAMILASILMCILGTILFKIEFPFGNYKKKYREIHHNHEQNK